MWVHWLLPRGVCVWALGVLRYKMKNVRREWILLVCPIGGVAPALLLMLVRTGSVPLALLLGLAQRVCGGRGRHCGSRSPTIPDSHRHWHIFWHFFHMHIYTGIY